MYGFYLKKGNLFVSQRRKTEPEWPSGEESNVLTR